MIYLLLFSSAAAPTLIYQVHGFSRLVTLGTEIYSQLTLRLATVRKNKLLKSLTKNHSPFLRSGGAVAHRVERATPGQEVVGSIPAAAARPIIGGSVLV